MAVRARAHPYAWERDGGLSNRDHLRDPPGTDG
jgi:hypothetical protein